MSGYAGVFPIPDAGIQASASRQGKTRVDYRKTEEAELVRRVQARDELAFREIVDRYQSKVFSIIFGVLRNRNDAEDISQQVFTKIYFSIHNFDFRSSLLTWIYKITATIATNIVTSRIAPARLIGLRRLKALVSVLNGMCEPFVG